MKEIYSFSPTELSKLIYDELDRLGKIPPNKPCSLSITFHGNAGQSQGCTVVIGDPIPGARAV